MCVLSLRIHRLRESSKKAPPFAICAENAKAISLFGSLDKFYEDFCKNVLIFDSHTIWCPLYVISKGFLFLHIRKMERTLAEAVEIRLVRFIVNDSTAVFLRGLPFGIEYQINSSSIYEAYSGIKYSQFNRVFLVFWNPISSWVRGHEGFWEFP